MKDIQHYTKRVAPQHKHPKFLKWLRTNLETVSDSEKLVSSYDYEFDIDNAAGVQLDMIGDIVGRKRLLDFQPADGGSAYLDDDMYRIILKAKISINHWNGTIPGMYELWGNLFPDYYIFIQDNHDMTMAVYLEGYTPNLLIELVANDYIIPRPEGVGFKLWIVVREQHENYDYYAGAMTETIHENISEDGQPAETTAEYSGAAIYQIIREEFIE